MCGLHGFITTDKRVTNADDFISNGYVAGSLRGTDASGIAAIDMIQGIVDVQKLPVSGPFFIGDKHARGLMLSASSNYQITMCHTRAMTSGQSGINAAHPFTVDDGNRILVGCHNGTLTGWKEREDGKKFTVDSEWALNRIFKKGLDAFKEFNGAFCFTFWDSTKPNELNIALNDDRTLFVAMLEEGAMAYASELGMLWWLLERNRIKIKGQILKLTGKHWYSFDGDTPEKLEKWTKVALPEVELGRSTPTNYNAHSSTGYNYSTTVEKVDALLRRISTTPSTALVAMQQAGNASAIEPADDTEIVVENLEDGKSTRSVMTTKEEIVAARDIEVMGLEGTFNPGEFDEETHTMGGYFASVDGNIEFRAFIRNADELEKKAHPYSIWTTKVIGVVDTGDELIAVCAKPSHLGIDREALEEDTTGTVH